MTVARNEAFMWLNFLILGLISAGVAWLLERRRWPWRLRGPLLFCATALFAFAIYVMSGAVFLSGTVWYNSPPYRELILFMLMVGGMAARSLSQAIEERRRQITNLKKDGKPFEKLRLQLDFWEFADPLLVSVITFSGLLSQIGDENLKLTVIALSFETGFFWQTLLKNR